MGKTQETFLTAVFKLHNPSGFKRRMMYSAMERYHLTYDVLLKAARSDIEKMAVAKDKSNRKEGLKQLEKRLKGMAKSRPLGSGPKQAVVKDVMGNLTSYLALCSLDDEDKNKAKTSYPAIHRLRVRPDELPQALDSLATATTLSDEKKYRDRMYMLQKPGIPRPISILTNRAEDGALILMNDAKRLFVFINLLPKKSRFAKEVDLTGLIDTRTGKIMSRKTSCGILCPLECSQWHIDKLLSKGRIQSSNLIFDGKDFYFAASFKFTSEVRQPVNYLGVDQGYVMLAAYRVIDPTGKLLAEGSYSGEYLRSIQMADEKRQRNTQKKGRIYRSQKCRRIANNEIHKLANILVELAVKYNAWLVLEDLSNISNGPHHKKPKGARKSGWRRLLSRAQYGKLKRYIDYRLRMMGFPPMGKEQHSFLEAYPAHTSTTCSKCGHQDKANRQSQAVFLCKECYHQDNADLNASSIIAAKGTHLMTVIKGKRKGQRLSELEKFNQWYKDLINGAGEHGSAL